MGFKDKKKKLKRQNKRHAHVDKKKSLKTTLSNVENVELLSKEQVKKIEVNSTCATRASGKRKRKMLKRLRHQQKPEESDKNEVEMAEDEKRPSKIKKRTKIDDMDTL